MGRVKVAEALSMRDLRKLVENHDLKSFRKIKKYLSYDEKGNNVLVAYLRKVTHQLVRLPDAELGDLMAEADKQVWRCANWYVERANRGEKNKISFKIYYYCRLRQCIIDRVRATIRPVDYHNTHALSLDEIRELYGYDYSSGDGEFDRKDLEISVAEIVKTLSKRERLFVKLLSSGRSPGQIKKSLLLKVLRNGRDEAIVRKTVNRFIKEALFSIQESFGELWEVYNGRF